MKTIEVEAHYFGPTYYMVLVVLPVAGALILSLAFFAVRSIVLRRRLPTISELIGSMWGWWFICWFVGVAFVLFVGTIYILLWLVFLFRCGPIVVLPAP